MQLPQRQKSGQDLIHLQFMLQAYVNPKLICLRWTVLPEPGVLIVWFKAVLGCHLTRYSVQAWLSVPDFWFKTGQGWNLCCPGLYDYSIDILDGQYAAWPPHLDSSIWICCKLFWELQSVQNCTNLDLRLCHHSPLAPDCPLHYSQLSFGHQ